MSADLLAAGAGNFFDQVIVMVGCRAPKSALHSSGQRLVQCSDVELSVGAGEFVEAAGGKGFLVHAALGARDAAQTLAKAVADELTKRTGGPGLDILVNNVGGADYADIKRAKDFGKECAAALGPNQAGINYKDITAPPGGDNEAAARSVARSVGPGTWPLNVHAGKKMPGAISISRSTATSR